MAQIDSDYDLATPQGVFDHVADALLKQGEAAMSQDGYCRYLLAGGCRCAAGHLMHGPDEVLVTMTGTLTCEFVTSYLDERIAGPAWTVARRMQDVHDGAAQFARAYNPPARVVPEDERNTVFIGEFKRRMVEAAKEFKLSDAKVVA